MRLVIGNLLIGIGIIVCLSGAGVTISQYAPADTPLGSLAVVSFAGQHTQLIMELVGSVMFLAGVILDCTAALVRVLKR